MAVTNIHHSRVRKHRSFKSGLSLAGLICAMAFGTLAQPPAQAPVHGKPAHSWFQIGKASWYGRSFDGRKTATGERFNMNALTCAHPTLPLGSWVRVTNLANSKSTFLRVNDRGPVSPSLIVDLSYAAAQKLGIGGLGRVKLEPVRKGDARMAEAMAADQRPAIVEVAADRATVRSFLPASPDAGLRR